MASSVLGRVRLARTKLTLPERVPQLARWQVRLFRVVFYPLLLFAIVGPIVGFWHRLSSETQNSALLVGSRAGLVLSEADLSQVRYPVGNAARGAGIEPGDDIVSINGHAVAKVVPLSDDARARPNDARDRDYELFSQLIEGSKPVDLNIMLRGPDGTIRTLQVRTGEHHIEGEALQTGLPPSLLSIIDLCHVLTYPILLWIAWLMHRRAATDPVSCLLSLAIVLTVGMEQPAAATVRFVLDVPEVLHRVLYDLGNICLLAGLLLFPSGELRPRATVVALCALPFLPFLSGDAYRLTFLMLLALGFSTVIRRLRESPPLVRQQLKFLLFSLAGYPIFITLALIIDVLKGSIGSFAISIAAEAVGGMSFGLAYFFLNIGLFAALRRYRLYDAEALISRSASFAAVTIAATGLFAATTKGMESALDTAMGAGEFGLVPGLIGTTVAAIMIQPIHKRVHGWAEQRFQKDLVSLRKGLPNRVDDLRETASLAQIIEVVLERVMTGVRATRSAVVLGDQSIVARGIIREDVQSWLQTSRLLECTEVLCVKSDPLFPIRVPLSVAHDSSAPIGWLLIGPRSDGSNYSKEELRVLAHISDPVARAIQIAQGREENGVAEASWKRRIEERMHQLEQTLSEAISAGGRDEARPKTA